uniref:Uncharacterized protein n=1 Tax=Panagrolaimus sp. JU765 TaxID=591449 RepID=A0AC34QNI6_9BILA
MFSSIPLALESSEYRVRIADSFCVTNNARNDNRFLISEPFKSIEFPVGIYPVIFGDSPFGTIIDDLRRYFVPMQLPMTNPMSMPSRYNSYFAAASPASASSRPIAINNRLPQRFNGRESRVMGLDFTPAHVPEVADSFYVMDFMDCEDTTASTSSQQTEQILARISTEDNKENGPRVKDEDSGMIVLGELGHRSYKRPTPPMEECLIHEETESETGISDDDDDCRSNCGCVHSAYSLEPTSVPGNRFRSIADIIGYAQVVKAERAAALAELQSAVEKWQQNAHFRAAQH